MHLSAERNPSLIKIYKISFEDFSPCEVVRAHKILDKIMLRSIMTVNGAKSLNLFSLRGDFFLDYFPQSN